MVQFGKTLNDVVKSDWRCHAVAYVELKRALSESHATPSFDITNDGGDADGPSAGVLIEFDVDRDNGCIEPGADNETNKNDVHSVHTESSYYISDNQKANFFRIYENSIRRLTDFYENRMQWAIGERGALEKAVGKRILDDKKAKADNDTNMDDGAQSGKTNEDDQSSSSASVLIHQINDFCRDLGLVLEFLELNATAFSKILKKFDKRTGSDLREAKLKELKAQHPYLYDGGELKRSKTLTVDWVKQLQLIVQQDDKLVVGHLKGHFSPFLSFTSNASYEGHHSMLKRVLLEKIIDPNGGENPQESSPTNEIDYLPKKIAPRMKEAKKNSLAPGRNKAVQTMIDRVNEGLCLQKADSPFFDQALEQEQNPPPSFSNLEVELADELGHGEFCKIYEVSQFNVPESCHICFLHRGFNDPVPSLQSFLKSSTKAEIPITVTNEKRKPESANNEQPSVQATQAPMEDTIKGNTSFSFGYDANIDDYDDLASDHEEDDYEHTTRGFMKDHCLRNGEARYAIKRIRTSLVGEEEITDAALDLAREAEFLAFLKHPNIIRIRGTINVPGHPKFSLILDRLYDTLEVQMKKWKVDVKRYQGKFKGLIGKNKMMLDKMWMDRLVASNDLARAMAYLHTHGILHRDIKPANIGFDVRGDIKIFDFGLAKELKPSECEGEDKYHTDGLAGTRRYMAPEVAQIVPYGLSADVYSFGILMWEMLALTAAFEKYTREKHYKEIIVEGKRPKVYKSWPFLIKNLLQRCWHKVPSERPTFQAICELIKFGLPVDDDDGSGRSTELMLRSYRSNHGRDDNCRAGVVEPEHKDEFTDGNDSLSQSIRIKSSRLNKH